MENEMKKILYFPHSGSVDDISKFRELLTGFGFTVDETSSTLPPRRALLAYHGIVIFSDSASEEKNIKRVLADFDANAPSNDFLLTVVTPDDLKWQGLLADFAIVRITPPHGLEFAAHQVDTIFESYFSPSARGDEDAGGERLKRESARHTVALLSHLQTRERNFLVLSVTFSLLTIGSLFLFMLAILQFGESLLSPPFDKNISNNLTLLVSIKNASLLLLGYGLAHYSYLLSKRFFSEYAMFSDRRHAISYGDLYIRMFGDAVKNEDFVNVFSYWNIDRNAVNHKDDAEELPVLIERIKQLIQACKP